MHHFSFFLIPALAAAACAQVVINEIHYDPPDVTRQEEFIELHNAGASPVSIGGWRIEDGVNFTFAGGTTIPAGGYVVVAQNPAQFQARYGFAPHGPWSGSLKNSGERVQLRDSSGALVDEVSYGSGFPWPTAARGAGQSMELIHPALDNDLGGSWRSTPETVIVARGAGGWRYRPGSSEASAPVDAWRGVAFAEDGTWTTGTLPLGYGEPGLNTTISGMQGSYWSIFLRKTFTLPPGGVPNSLILRIRADDGCVPWINGVPITPTIRTSGTPVYNGGAAGTGFTTANAPEPVPYVDIPVSNAASFLQPGTNVIALHVFNTTLGSSDLLIDAELVSGATGGTPGAQNSVFSTTAPPQIRQVAHTPEQPAAGVPVIVTAKITDPDGAASATLSYQLVNPGAYIRITDAAYATSWTNLPMNDAGTDGDAVAGDGVFSVTLPAALQTNRRLVRYRISATDGTTAVTVPYADDEQPNFAYFVYNGVPAYSGAIQPGAAAPRGTIQTFQPALLNSMQIWTLITDATDHDNMLYNSAFNGVRFYGTFVYEGKVYDHIQYNVRGIGSTYVSGKNKFSIKFNRARDVRIRDNWGNYFSETWNSVPVDACASPWAAVHRGMAGVEEAVGYRLYELAGMASLRTTYLHLRVVRSPNQEGTSQYDTDFWGLYMALEPTEGNFLDERGLPDGNLYAIEGSGGDKKHQGPTQPTNTSDWTSFRDGATQNGQTQQWYRDNMDLQTFYTFFTLNRFCGNVDVRPGDNYRYYHRPDDNRWVIIPYDLDMMALPAHHWGGTLADGVVWAGSPSQSVLLSRHPALAIELRNRAREILSLLASDSSPSGGQIGQLIDEYAQMVNPTGAPQTWADVDEVMWSDHPRTNGGGAPSGQTSHRRNFYRTPFSDARGGLGGTPSTNWTRTLPNAVGEYSSFEESMNYLTNFMTNTWPGGTWLRSNGNPAGYGYQYLLWESLYGGWGDCNTNPSTPDLAFPNTPTITYSGPPGFPANALDFTSSPFSPSPTGGTTFAAMQWRIGEIYAPGIPGYIPGHKRRYEIEHVWTSPEITTFTASQRLPLLHARPGATYRARVRHKDANGRWSQWSTPVQFIPSTPDVTSYQQAIVISEISYNPAPVTPDEFAAGFSSDDFEWIELKNTSTLPVDMTGLRFTKGVDFDFPAGWTIPPGGFALVVKNQAAFQMRHGTAHNAAIAGSYGSDNLANSGENLKLSYGAGTGVIEFTYSDSAPWPAAADGTGRTLVLRAPASLPAHTDPANWRASHAIGGSPAADDILTYAAWQTAFPAATDLLGDNDGDLLPNLIEYALLGHPLLNNPAPLPTSALQNITVLGIPGDYLTLTFTRRSDAADLTFHPEFTTSLTGTWNSGVLLHSSPGDGTITETWRSPYPLATEPSQYGRLRITSP